jgi:hypothetical protein
MKIKTTDENPSKNFSEKDRFYINKTEKRYRNCNSTFGSKNKLHQHLRNYKASDNTRRAIENYADKAGKYCRNYNSTFGSENKLYQYLRNCKISDNIRRTNKFKIKPTIIIPGKNIFILKSSKKFKSNLGNYFRIFNYATVKILLN